MPGRDTEKKIPGERARDEQRSGGPRMHGRGWHDHDVPKDFELEVMAGEGAATEVESGHVQARPERVSKSTRRGMFRKKGL